jgi:hypothetical protein
MWSNKFGGRYVFSQGQDKFRMAVYAYSEHKALIVQAIEFAEYEKLKDIPLPSSFKYESNNQCRIKISNNSRLNVTQH